VKSATASPRRNGFWVNPHAIFLRKSHVWIPNTQYVWLLHAFLCHGLKNDINLLRIGVFENGNAHNGQITRELIIMLRIWCTICSSHHVHSGLPTRDSSPECLKMLRLLPCLGRDDFLEWIDFPKKSYKKPWARCKYGFPADSLYLILARSLSCCRVGWTSILGRMLRGPSSNSIISIFWSLVHQPRKRYTVFPGLSIGLLKPYPKTDAIHWIYTSTYFCLEKMVVAPMIYWINDVKCRCNRKM